MPGVPHLQALAVRGGKLYAAAKNYSDDWAIGVSSDDGLTFKPMMRYTDVTSIRSCAQKACLDSCEFQASQVIWPLAICGAPPKPPTVSKSGCGCGLFAPGASAPGALLLLAALCFAHARRRRR